MRMCRDIHGFEGPIKVSFGNYTYPIKEDFLRATESQGIPTTDDLQDLVTGQYVKLHVKINAI
jgi:alcohol oxidase